MLFYNDKILKKINKNIIPKNIFIHINNAFKSINLTKDLTLFDISRIKGKTNRVYYRLRKGKYRAIFYIENNNIYVIGLDKREDIYKK